MNKGEKVKWTSSQRGDVREGIIFAVVPANKNPIQCIDPEELKKANIKPLGLIESLEPRPEVSYLVERCFTPPYANSKKNPNSSREIRAIFWPRTVSRVN